MSYNDKMGEGWLRNRISTLGILSSYEIRNFVLVFFLFQQKKSNQKTIDKIKLQNAMWTKHRNRL